MNNFQNYSGQRFQPMMPQFNYQPSVAQMPMQPIQPIPQMVEPTPNYDFYGVQVRSFEEAKNYPYCCEKPLFLLDAQNEKVYIKKMENGIPSVVSYEMKEIKENTVQNTEKKIEPKEEKQPQFDFASEFSKMKEEITQTLRQDMQNQFEALKTTHENENKSNKKW